MLPSACSGGLFLLALPFLLGVCLPSRSGPPFPLRALALVPLALAHLDSLPPHDLVLWADGSVPFPFGGGGSGVLAGCSLCGAEATLFFSAGPVCSSFSAGACAILRALCWSWRHHGVCRFSSLLLLSDSRSDLAALSLLHLSFYLKLCGRSGRNCLFSPPVLSDYNGSPDTRFSRGTTQLISWPDGERCLHLPQSLVVSLLLSLVSTLVFSRTGGVLSLKYFDTQVPSISTEELVLPRHACCVLSRLRCNGHSLLLGSYLSRTGRIENSFCSACGHSSQDISHLILHCPATDSLCRSLFGDSLSLYDFWSRPWGVAGFWGSMVFRHAPIPRKGSGNQQQQLRRCLPVL